MGCSWVDKLQKGTSEESYQDICDFGHTSYAISKFIERNPRANAYSLSKETVLWRHMLRCYPMLLSFLFFAQDGLKKSFVSFFKEFYSVYWDPSRRSTSTKLFSMIPFSRKFVALLDFLIPPQRQSEFKASTEDGPYEDSYALTLQDNFKTGRTNCEHLCLTCQRECRKIIEEYYPKAVEMEEGTLGSTSGSCGSHNQGYSFDRAISIIGGMCRRVVFDCKHHYCQEIHVSQFFETFLKELQDKRCIDLGKDSQKSPKVGMPERPSLWKECPQDISRLFQRRYRVPVAYWLAYISMIDKKDDPERYAACRVERRRFVRLMNSISSNTHRSGLEKFARFLMFGKMSIFDSTQNEPRGLEDIFPDLDVDEWIQPILKQKQ